jgi:hypothetical protein
MVMPHLSTSEIINRPASQDSLKTLFGDPWASSDATDT